MIKEQLNMLWNLQLYEQSKTAIIQKKQTYNAQELKTIWNDLTAITTGITQQQARLTIASSQASDSEKSIEELNKQLKTLETKLYANGIKNIKEIDQLRNKYEKLKSVIALREDELLELMDKCDQLTNLIAELNEQLIEKKRMHEEKQRLMAADKALLDKSLLDIEQEIIVCSQQIEKELLHNYNELKRSIDMPIAKLKNDYCSGCHRSLPITKVETAKIRMVYCDNCGRILIPECKDSK